MATFIFFIKSFTAIILTKLATKCLGIIAYNKIELKKYLLIELVLLQLTAGICRQYKMTASNIQLITKYNYQLQYAKKRIKNNIARY